MGVIRLDGPLNAECHARLVQAFGIQRMGMLVELNPVLGTLRRLLNPHAEKDQPGERGRALFLYGLQHEGKAAQAYFLARDWLRLTELEEDAIRPTVILLQETADDGLDLKASDLKQRQVLIILTRPGTWLATDSRRNKLLELLQDLPGASLLTTCNTNLLTANDQNSLNLMRQIQNACCQSFHNLEMQGIPPDLIKHHLQARTFLASCKLSDTALHELIKLARIESTQPAMMTSRLLLGLVHKALRLYEANQGSDICNLYAGLLREYALGELEMVSQEDRKLVSRFLRSMQATRQLGHISLDEPVDRHLLSEVLSHSTSCTLDIFIQRFPGLLLERNDEVMLLVPGLEQLADKLGIDDDRAISWPSTVSESALKEHTESFAKLYLQNGQAEKLIGYAEALTTMSAMELGVKLAAKPEFAAARALALHPAVQAGYYWQITQRGEKPGWTLPVAAWTAVLQCSIPLDWIMEHLDETFVTAGSGDRRAAGWIEILQQITPRTSEVLVRWYEVFSRLDTPEDPGLGEKEWSLLLSHLRYLADLARDSGLFTAVLQALLDAGIIELEYLLSDLMMEMKDSDLDWSDLLGYLASIGPIHFRVQIVTLRAAYQERFLAQYIADLTTVLDTKPAEASLVLDWACIEACYSLARVVEQEIPGIRVAVKQKRQAWIATEPVITFVARRVLIAPFSPILHALRKALTETLQGVSLQQRILLTFQVFFSAILSLSKYGENTDREVNLAECMFWFTGCELNMQELLRDLTESLVSASRVRQNTVANTEASKLEHRILKMLEDSQLDAALSEVRALRDEAPGSRPGTLALIDLYIKLEQFEEVGQLLEAADCEIPSCKHDYQLAKRRAILFEHRTEYVSALAVMESLLATSRGDRKEHMEILLKTVQLACEAGSMDKILKHALDYFKYYGPNDFVIRKLLKSSIAGNLKLEPAQLVVMTCLIKYIQPESLALKLEVWHALGMSGEAHSMLAALGRANVRALTVGPRQDNRPAAQLGIEFRILLLLSYLNTSRIFEANTVLAELLLLEPHRTDIKFFGAITHLGFAKHYSSRNMRSLVNHHLSEAQHLAVQVLWHGFGSITMLRVFAEIACLRVELSQIISRDDLVGAREMIRASLYGDRSDIGALDLEVNMVIKHFECAVRDDCLTTFVDAVNRTDTEIRKLVELAVYADVEEGHSSLIAMTQAVHIKEQSQVFAAKFELAFIRAVVEFARSISSDKIKTIGVERLIGPLASHYPSGPAATRSIKLIAGRIRQLLAEGWLLESGYSSEARTLYLQAMRDFNEASSPKSRLRGTLSEDDSITLGLHLQQVENRLLDV
jgi:hypothetical protein